MTKDWYYVDNRARALFRRMYNENPTWNFDSLSPYHQDFWRAIARTVIQEEEDLQASRERADSVGAVW